MSANGRKINLGATELQPLVDETQAAPAPKAARADDRITVAYHAGPSEIGFYTRTWTRGAPQTIPADDWKAMQQRGDFNEFDFQEEQ